MSQSNVVPMVPPSLPAASQGVWPMPSMMPVPGCCPPGGMDALMKCYCDIQAATQFICTVMVDCINTNPAVAEAMIAAIEKSGSSLPLVGVTNGQAAQPGQVGEFIQFSSTQSINVPAGGEQTFNLPMGVLQPGDWDVESYIQVQSQVTLVSFGLQPAVPGFSSNVGGSLVLPGSGAWQYIRGEPAQGLISVPSLLAFTVSMGGPAGTTGQFEFYVVCRRMR